MKHIETIINRLRVAMTDARQNESHFESWMILNEAICDAIDALAEQPVQQQEPVVNKALADAYQCGFHAGRKSAEILPPSKPWVGLTDEEMRDLEKQFNAERVRTSDEEYLIIYPGDYWAWQRAIEAKLREKNA